MTSFRETLRVSTIPIVESTFKNNRVVRNYLNLPNDLRIYLMKAINSWRVGSAERSLARHELMGLLDRDKINLTRLKWWGHKWRNPLEN